MQSPTATNSPTTSDFKKKTHASKEAFGDNSYYWWHGKHSDARGYEDREPIKLEEKVVTVVPSTKYKTIPSYSFLDGSKGVARVYIDLEDVGDLPADCIKCEFSKRKFDLTVMGLRNENYRLIVDSLYDEIDVETSSVAIKASRITVNMKKIVDLSWSSLKKDDKKN